MLEDREEELERIRHDRLDCLDRLADDLGRIADVRAEQRLGDDLERQLHHVLVDVALRAGAPFREESLRPLNHDLAVRRDAVAMKSRLREPALPPPKVTLCREESFAEHRLQGPLEECVLLPEPITRHEHVFDEIGMTEEDRLQRSDRNADDVAMPFTHFSQKPERVSPERDEVAEQGKTRRLWRSLHEHQVTREDGRCVSSDYVTDVSYVRRVDNDLAPARLRLVAALNGFPPPPSEGFTYCELGCGSADTTITLAAANPSSRFFGIDINREHIALGERLASDGEIVNVDLLERDFEAVDDEVPPLDYLCAHGLASWIAPAKRHAMFAFAKRKLKPGGLFYVSYNTMPGWAGVEPLRQILLTPTLGIECDSLERARRGLAFAKELEAAGAEYFRSNPSAKDMLAIMEREGLSYIAHEYLNTHWAPMYFAQVAFELAQNDLHFVGGLPIHLNYRDLALPSAVTKLFEKMTDRLTFESLKDFGLNEFFRRDVYVRGRPGRDGKHTNDYLDTTPFGTLHSRMPESRDVRLPHQTIRYDKPIFDALFLLLQDGARTGRALAELPELAPFGIEKVRAALLRLCLGGHVFPVMRSTQTKPAPKGLRIATTFNRKALERPSTTGYVVASPITGAGISLTGRETIALRALTEIPASDRDAWLRTHFERKAWTIELRGRKVDDIDEQLEVIRDEITAFETIGMKKLFELGVVEPNA
jgi:SAM-dependent methyltransferase